MPGREKLLFFHHMDAKNMKGFILLSLSLFALANTCGGNCPTNYCPSCPCGTKPSYQNIAYWCAKFSGWDQACCQCIVSHESGGNANAANYNLYTDSTFDVGLWQINLVNWGVCNNGNPPCDLNANLQCAIDVWRWGGNSFHYWTTAAACGCA
jgi:hypothetical protein